MTKLGVGTWGLAAFSLFFANQGCGGKSLIHEVGQINGAGKGSADAGGGGVGGSVGGGGTHVDVGGSSTNDAGAGFGANGGGGASMIGPVELNCDTCELLATGEDIRAVAATDDTVFWLEHGSYDELNNYRNDGRLMSIPVAGGKAHVVAKGLEGPIELKLSAHYCYLLIDESTSSEGKRALVRVPLAGGAVELIQVLTFLVADPSGSRYGDWIHSQVALGADYAAWVGDDSIYRMAETPAAQPEILAEVESQVFQLFGDDLLAYSFNEQGLTTVPFASGDSKLVQKFANLDDLYFSPSIAGDSIYSVENGAQNAGSSTYLAVMPKQGGPWTRVSMTSNVFRLAVSGENYVISSTSNHGLGGDGCLLLSGNVTSNAAPQLVAQDMLNGTWAGDFHSWDISSAGIFLAAEGKLYRASYAN